MEIPTEEIIKRLDSHLINSIAGPVALAAIEVIEAQALEIRELQAGICRLRNEYQMIENERMTDNIVREYNENK